MCIRDRATLGHLVSLFGTCQGPLGGHWGLLGLSGHVLVFSGDSLRPSWRHLGLSWAVRGPRGTLGNVRPRAIPK
eukprot:5396776-Pyramimonas_sp.AAC.1